MGIEYIADIRLVEPTHKVAPVEGRSRAIVRIFALRSNVGLRAAERAKINAGVHATLFCLPLPHRYAAAVLSEGGL